MNFEENPLPTKNTNPPLVYSTGSLRMDIALRTGGVFGGELVSIGGVSGSGKTLLAQNLVASAQRQGRMCAWIDNDHTFAPHLASLCDVQLEELVIINPGHLEAALEMLHLLVLSGAFDMIVLDPLPPIPFVSTQPEYGYPLVEVQRFVQRLRSLIPFIKRHQVTIVLTHQTLPERSPRVPPQFLSGPIPFQLLASLQITLHVESYLRDQGPIIGQRVKARLRRRKIIPCSHHTEFDIIYSQGIRKSGEIFDLGLALNLLQHQGGCYHYRGIPLGKERNEALSTLEQQDLLLTLEQNIRRILLSDTAFT